MKWKGSALVKRGPFCVLGCQVSLLMGPDCSVLRDSGGNVFWSPARGTHLQSECAMDSLKLRALFYRHLAAMAASTAETMVALSGFRSLAKRPTSLPSRPMRNFSKFH